MDKFIAVFAYGFPHRKTTDFLQLIRAKGFNNVIVFGAPMKQLSHQDNRHYFNKFNAKFNVIDTEQICVNLGYKYISCEHDDLAVIQSHVNEFDIDTAIISGARILKKKIIDVFASGIVNIHPGALPETAGLDAFYYTLIKNAAPGVTLHTINHKVDEGNYIDFIEYEISGVESITELQESLYQCQLLALSGFLDRYIKGEIEQKPIHRPSKNEPMLPDEKLNALSYFGIWRSAQHHKQLLLKLLAACEKGSVTEYKKYDPYSTFVNTQLKNCWTPLVVASFNQHLDLVKYLIAQGANVNYATPKGTTVLMYAKTALINSEDLNYQLLECLIKAGADINAQDIFGKTAMDYIAEFDDRKLMATFAEYNKNAIY